MSPQLPLLTGWEPGIRINKPTAFAKDRTQTASKDFRFILAGAFHLE
jgi:hypothetical protein